MDREMERVSRKLLLILFNLKRSILGFVYFFLQIGNKNSSQVQPKLCIHLKMLLANNF